MKKSRRFEAGFTAVEVLVTIIVATIFIYALYLLYTSLATTSASDRNRANASDLAYSYLRKYASADLTPADWDTTIPCDTTTDLSANSSATGSTLDSGTIASPPNAIPKPVTYTITAIAPYGCSGTNYKKPIQVEAKVTYGPNSRVVKQTTMVGYY